MTDFREVSTEYIGRPIKDWESMGMKLAGIEMNLEHTMTRAEVMKAREEDAEKIKSGKIKIGVQKLVKGYNVL